MLKAKHPLQALEEVYKFNYWNIIFYIPEESDLKDQNLITSIPHYGFELVSRGIQSIETHGLLTEKWLLQEKDEIK